MSKPPFHGKPCVSFVVRVLHPASSLARSALIFRNKELMAHCDSRGLDSWTVDVKGGLSSCIDLVAEEAVYHVYCYNRFSKHKSLNVDLAPRQTRNPLASRLFDSLCEWIESGTGDELFDLVELRQKMVDDYVSVLCSDVCDDESAHNIMF